MKRHFRLTAVAGIVALVMGSAALLYHVGAAGKDDDEGARKGGAWLGVALSDSGGRVRVVEVSEDSPAEAAGLRDGDVIIEIGGKEIDGSEDVVSMIRGRKPGDQVEIKVRRDGEEMTKSAKLAERADRPEKHIMIERMAGEGGPEHFEFAFGGTGSYLGVELTPLTSGLRKYFNAPDGKGVLVGDVIKDSPADKAGLVAGDVIIEVNGKPVSGPGDLVRALRDVEPGDRADLRIVRDKSQMSVSATVEKQEGHRMMCPPGGGFHDMSTWSGIDRGEMREAMEEAHRAMRESQGRMQEDLRRALDEARVNIRETMQDALEYARRGIEKARLEMREAADEI